MHDLADELNAAPPQRLSVNQSPNSNPNALKAPIRKQSRRRNIDMILLIPLLNISDYVENVGCKGRSKANPQFVLVAPWHLLRQAAGTNAQPLLGWAYPPTRKDETIPQFP
jgi:hypothetical protein